MTWILVILGLVVVLIVVMGVLVVVLALILVVVLMWVLVVVLAIILAGFEGTFYIRSEISKCVLFSKHKRSSDHFFVLGEFGEEFISLNDFVFRFFEFWCSN